MPHKAVFPGGLHYLGEGKYSSKTLTPMAITLSELLYVAICRTCVLEISPLHSTKVISGHLIF